jgi:hypothetical protein
MADANSILENAISDVGHWRWWAEALPERFQVEFGGVQLWNPPTREGGPPSGVIALRFIQPSLVLFLTAKDAEEVEPDWPEALHEDRMEPLSVAYDQFTLTSDEQIASMAKDCTLRFVVGDSDGLAAGSDPVRLGFRAGPIGLIVRAKEMVVLSSAGELTPEKIAEASAAWWAYWKEYWARRDTENPLPRDYACEVTIPLKGE